MASQAELALLVKLRDEASRGLKEVDKNVSGLGKTLGAVGKIAAGFLAAGAIAKGFQAFKGYIGGALSAASDLEQTIGGVEAVFGDSAHTIIDWGRTAHEQAGLSKNAFNQAAAPIGAMLKTAGFGMEEVTSKTIDLTKKGADLAATFGGSVKDAMDAISSLMRGETNPIERYGVSIKQLDVNARALANTGKSTASELTALELATARLDLLFQQTSASTGQFAREADTAAGKAERLAAKQENMSAQIGTYLLPLQVKWTEAKVAFVELLATKVIPIVAVFAERHLPAVRRALDDVVSFVRQHWPIIATVINHVANEIATRIQGIVDVFTGVINHIKLVIDFWTAIVNGDWAGAWNTLKSIAENGAKTAVNAAVAAFGVLPNIMLGIMEKVINIAVEGWNKVAGVFSKRVEVFGENINPLAGEDLTIGNVSLPRLPASAFEIPFRELSEAVKGTTSATYAQMQAYDESIPDINGAADSLAKLEDRVSKLFSQDTIEEAALRLKIAKEEWAGRTEAADALRAQLDVMKQFNEIQQLRLNLAKQGLHSEEEQNRLVDQYIDELIGLEGASSRAAFSLEGIDQTAAIAAAGVSKLADATQQAATVIIDSAKAAWDGVRDMAQRNSAPATPSGGGGASSPVEAAVAAIGSYFSFGGGKSYATGTPFVPHTGLAMLHRGEAVIPASQNRGGGVSINVTFSGPVYGIHDLERTIRDVTKRAAAEGAFRGYLVAA